MENIDKNRFTYDFNELYEAGGLMPMKLYTIKGEEYNKIARKHYKYRLPQSLFFGVTFGTLSGFYYEVG